jgi:hypothetical protein
MSVSVDLGRVESVIHAVETELKWHVPMLGRTVIYNLFISLATEDGGYEVPMTDETRQQALTIAHDGLGEFVKQVVNKSKEVAERSGHKGNRVGFPIVVHEMDAWAVRLKCHCWPR